MRESPAREAKLPEAIPHGFDAVGARENEPVVAPDIFQSLLKWPVRWRLADLNEWDFDYRCPDCASSRKGCRPGDGHVRQESGCRRGDGVRWASWIRCQVSGVRSQASSFPET